MPRSLVQSCFTLAAAAVLAAAVAGCEDMGSVFENHDQAFTKPLFQTPDWAKISHSDKAAFLGPRGPVAPEDLVDAAGRCTATARAQAPAEAAPAPAPAAPEAPAAPAAPPARPSYGSVAGDLASAPMPQGPPPAPMPVSMPANERMDTLQPGGGGAGPAAVGGIALGMTECDAVRRAGQPSNVAISAGDKGARKVVITYLTGTWPGIYTFDSGRLKEIDEVPEQQKPAKPAPKKKPKRKTSAKTATSSERMYVQ